MCLPGFFSSKKNTYEPGRLCYLLLNTCCWLNSKHSHRPMLIADTLTQPDILSHWCQRFTGSQCETSWYPSVIYHPRDPQGSCGACCRRWQPYLLLLGFKSSTAAGRDTWNPGMLLTQVCATQLLQSSKNNSALFCLFAFDMES